MIEDISRRKILGAAAMAPFAGVLRKIPSLGAARAEVSKRGEVQRRYLPNVTLQTQDGKKVRFYEDLIKNKVVTINFFFTNCDGICPMTTANLVTAKKLLGNQVGRDIFMNSITLKPQEDNPEALRKYMAKYQIKPDDGWTFLTGDPAEIERLRRSMDFTDPNPRVDKDDSQHIGMVRFGNEPLMLWAACPGMGHPSWLVKSLSWVIRPEETKAALAESRVVLAAK